MKLFVYVGLLSVLATAAYAQETPPPAAAPTADAAQQCVTEKIASAKLQQENSQLRSQLMQLQFSAVQQAGAAAKAEQERLEKLQPPAPAPEKKD